jgi:Domain of unknown function (DUF4279)
MKLKLKQYTHFAVRSQSLTPDELTELLGVQPDMTEARGSRVLQSVPGKPVPRAHMWDVECRDYKMSVDDQIGSVLKRLAPAREAIRKLVMEQDDANTVLSVARWFGDDDGVEQVTYWSDDPREDVLPFGWYLRREVLIFLAYVGAGLSVDEYDMLDDEEDEDAYKSDAVPLSPPERASPWEDCRLDRTRAARSRLVLARWGSGPLRRYAAHVRGIRIGYRDGS